MDGTARCRSTEESDVLCGLCRLKLILGEKTLLEPPPTLLLRNFDIDTNVLLLIALVQVLRALSEVQLLCSCIRQKWLFITFQSLQQTIIFVIKGEDG